MAGSRRYLVAVVLLATWAATTNAGEITRRGFESALLGREYRYSLYLPDGYERSEARYPVLYLLHGAAADEREWPAGGDVRATADRLVAAGEIPPLIIVMPGHRNSWWVDGNHEPAASVVREELIPHIDATLRTIARREGRLLGGLSAGGYGTVNLALSHPELFAAAAAFSPAVYEPLPPETSGSRRTSQFAREGTFDPETWRRLNYPSRLERYFAGETVVPFYLMSGDHDAYGIALQTARLFERLRQHQPDAVELRIVDGGHYWGVWREALPDALRYLCRFLKTGSPPSSARR
jgi:enterochelin esterase-like enzyme